MQEQARLRTSFVNPIAFSTESLVVHRCGVICIMLESDAGLTVWPVQYAGLVCMVCRSGDVGALSHEISLVETLQV